VSKLPVMSRDYKNVRAASTAAAARGGTPVWMGILVGVLVGLCIALGVALYINKGSNPFMQRKIAERAAEKAAERENTKRSGIDRQGIRFHCCEQAREDCGR
jgi:H+/gluconate symporter-like permease